MEKWFPTAAGTLNYSASQNLSDWYRLQIGQSISVCHWRHLASSEHRLDGTQKRIGGGEPHGGCARRMKRRDLARHLMGHRYEPDREGALWFEKPLSIGPSGKVERAEPCGTTNVSHADSR